jgi:pyrimidine operon attenuation protein / uracil phosphoribosyltransferase
MLTAQDVRKNLERMARKIVSENKSSSNLAFIGIRTRGLFLAKRMAQMIKKARGTDVPVGEMDITLYRDDLNALLPQGKVDHTRIPFDINNRTIILFDDVLHTGRTVRAAVDHV